MKNKPKCEECDREFGSRDAFLMHNKSKHPNKAGVLSLNSKQIGKIRNYAIILLLIIIIGGFIYWRAVPPTNASMIEVPAAHTFGTVSQAAGAVTAFLTITNTGTKDLIINGLETSCSCTSVRVINDGVEGPKFSMAGHGTNPENWATGIQPGKEAQLKITYDPNVHKDLRGSVTRSVFIFSNAARNEKTEVRINAIQVD